MKNSLLRGANSRTGAEIHGLPTRFSKQLQKPEHASFEVGRLPSLAIVLASRKALTGIGKGAIGPVNRGLVSR